MGGLRMPGCYAVSDQRINRSEKGPGAVFNYLTVIEHDKILVDLAYGHETIRRSPCRAGFCGVPWHSRMKRGTALPREGEFMNEHITTIAIDQSSGLLRSLFGFSTETCKILQ